MLGYLLTALYTGASEKAGLMTVAFFAGMMVNTRLPVERLVDWADQAVLILLLDEGDDDELAPWVVELRRAGALGPDAVGTALLDWLVLAIDNEPSISRIRRWRASDLGPDGHCREIRVDVGQPVAEPVPAAVPADESFATTA